MTSCFVCTNCTFVVETKLQEKHYLECISLEEKQDRYMELQRGGGFFHDMKEQDLVVPRGLK